MATTQRQPRTAKRTLLPEIELMLCTLVAEPVDDPNWIYEPKLDGLRVLGHYDGGRPTIISRNDKPQDFQFPEIVHALEECLTKPVILDGEVVCLDESGRSSFRLLQQRFHLLDAGDVRERMREYPACLYVFDIMYHDGRDVRALPLSERKALLRKAVKWSDRVRYTESVRGEAGQALLDETCRAGGEGIVGKRLDSPYRGGRSDDWIKVKCSGRQEFVIGGFTDPQRTRVGLGALLVGYYADDGKTLTYAGKVGTGYTSETLRDLRNRLGAIEQKVRPFGAGDPPRGPGVHWVRPKLVAEIEYAEWTQNGLLRQPRFEGLRMDKKPAQVRRERPKSAAAVKGKAARKTARAAAAKPPVAASRAKRAPASKSGRVEFTHVNKAMFPEAGITKGDVIQYYLTVSDKLLPHLRDRPITLERMPDGIGPGKPRFWQKNTPDYYPSWIPRVELPTEDGKRVRYALVNDVDTLSYFVNQGTITFHPFLSRAQDLDRPDFVLFDLDPGGAKFTDVVRIARTLHEVLDAHKVESFPKTSGKSGLHVLTPWTRPGGYDEARAWAMEVAQQVIEKLPALATVERLKSEREGRVYIDVIQNARGHHAVPPYVLRPTPLATVSTPLDWKEVTPKLDPKQFTIKTVLPRLAKKPDLMAPLAGG
jgi:bifunctional non-homologous end joining protein LigD